MNRAASLDLWERMWAPYDSPTYQMVIENLNANDIVLEIGAGELRLSRQIAKRVKRAYAIEIDECLLTRSSAALPANMHLITGDARLVPFPEEITAAVLLMRHCTHFSFYFNKLKSSNCQKLITNARWGMNCETIDMNAPACSFQHLDIGWYACRCGKRGFKPGSPELLTRTIEDMIWELDSCPACGRNQQDYLVDGH